MIAFYVEYYPKSTEYIKEGVLREMSSIEREATFILQKKKKGVFVCAGDNLPKLMLRFKSVNPINPSHNKPNIDKKRAETGWLEKSSQRKTTLCPSSNKKAS